MTYDSFISIDSVRETDEWKRTKDSIWRTTEFIKNKKANRSTLPKEKSISSGIVSFNENNGKRKFKTINRSFICL